jgi:hypothetical protein
VPRRLGRQDIGIERAADLLLDAHDQWLDDVDQELEKP